MEVERESAARLFKSLKSNCLVLTFSTDFDEEQTLSHRKGISPPQSESPSESVLPIDLH